MGLLALALIGAFGVGLFQALPLLGQKLENRLLAARKAEARANPIDQLQNFLLQKRQRVLAFKQAVVRIGAQIKSMNDMNVKYDAKVDWTRFAGLPTRKKQVWLRRAKQHLRLRCVSA